MSLEHPLHGDINVDVNEPETVSWAVRNTVYGNPYRVMGADAPTAQKLIFKTSKNSKYIF